MLVLSDMNESLVNVVVVGLGRAGSPRKVTEIDADGLVRVVENILSSTSKFDVIVKNECSVRWNQSRT